MNQKLPETAPAVLRALYAAYSEKHPDHLLTVLHPSHIQILFQNEMFDISPCPIGEGCWRITHHQMEFIESKIKSVSLWNGGIIEEPEIPHIVFLMECARLIGERMEAKTLFAPFTLHKQSALLNSYRTIIQYIAGILEEAADNREGLPNKLCASALDRVTEMLEIANAEQHV